MPDYALEVDAWTGAKVETLRFATKTLVTGRGDAIPNAVYQGRILDPGMLSTSILEGGGLVGRPTTGVGSIILNNGDGRLDALMNYGFDGRPFTLREVGDGQSPASGTVIARGLLAGLDSSDAWATLRLRIRDQLASLEAPLLTLRYAGTTTSAGLGVEGDEAMKDQIKPLVLGRVTSVAPKAVNLFDLVYQVSILRVSSIAVYDGAVPLTAGPDFATTAALLAWTQVPGQYATCLTSGFFRLGGDPAFTVTADVVEGATLADRSASRIASRMLDIAGASSVDRDSASFDLVHAFNPAELGIYIDSETNVLDLIGQALGSIGAALVPTMLGGFRTVSVGVPAGPPLASYDLRAIQSGSLSLSSGAGGDAGSNPAWSVALTWGRVWQTLTAADLDRANVSAAQKAILLSPTRTAVAQDASVKTAHPLAIQIKADTLFARQADAEAEAARLLSLHKDRRDRLGLTVPASRGRYPLGSTVRLAMPRFGFDAGKLFTVVSRQDDFKNRSVQIGLWG